MTFPMNKNISILYRYGQMFMAQRLKPYGIGPGQHGLILSIIREPGISQEQLAMNLGMDKGTIARLVQKLEQKGFIRRESLASDRRVNCLYPMAKALDIEEIIREKTREWYVVILQDVPPKDQETVFMLLEQMSKNAVGYMKSSLEQKSFVEKRQRK